MDDYTHASDLNSFTNLLLDDDERTMDSWSNGSEGSSIIASIASSNISVMTKSRAAATAGQGTVLASIPEPPEEGGSQKHRNMKKRVSLVKAAAAAAAAKELQEQQQKQQQLVHDDLFLTHQWLCCGSI
eukprot:CAMPEP_0118697586 /NCGR_PEP_ID=MMETSP0800-20121206/14621_1 /TAXON_ID=210618 ORGANISM="Striatella unipunctata, Strain CCMP2910" /NCGR_SAMPLE_ID=MMETSP0800 /ASSEMBLY_ACC=CAM_ASM_000638 /LENGTH=128 /DNA_ID=CAMNT_0006597099 /DNA_START=142 /DNA_END=528 /DNA_ORIENTATION=+